MRKSDSGLKNVHRNKVVAGMLRSIIFGTAPKTSPLAIGPSAVIDADILYTLQKTTEEDRQQLV